MLKSAALAFSIVLLVLASLYCGYLLGARQRAEELDRQFQMLNYRVWATDVNAKVRLLDLLRERRYEAAGSYLEGLLDVGLASLAGYAELGEAQPDPLIVNAVTNARDYRRRNPSHQVNEQFAAPVERALTLARP
jgi:hypothetical protein